MDLKERPEWITTVAGARVAQVDIATKQLLIQFTDRGSQVVFSEVPPAWTITLEGIGGRGRVEVAVAVQGKGVSWHLVARDTSEFHVPAVVQNISMVTSGRGIAAALTWLRSSGHLTLSSGRYVIYMGQAKDGEYTVQHEADSSRRDGLILDGPGQLRRLTGSAAGKTTIANPAPSLELVDIDAPVVVKGDCDGISCDSSSSLEIERSATGLVDIRADTVTAGSVKAHGTISVRELFVRGSVSPLAERLSVEVSGVLWCEGSLTDTDVALRPKDSATPVAIIGTRSVASRVTLAQGPVGNPRELTPDAIRAPERHSDISVTGSAITGSGSLELACHVISSRIDIDGDVVCDGSFAAAVNETRATALRARAAFFAGNIDLNGSAAHITDRLQAKSISNGEIDGSDGRLVIASTALRHVLARAAIMRIASDDSGVLVLEDSQLEASEHLHVVGGVDGDSTIVIAGDASFRGPVACTVPVLWKPAKPWQDVQCRQLDILGAFHTLGVEPAVNQEPFPQVVIGENGSIEDITIHGAAAVKLDRSTGTPLVAAMALGEGADVAVLGAAGSLPRVVALGPAALRADFESPGSELAVGLASSPVPHEVHIDPGVGTVRVNAPGTSAHRGELLVVPKIFVNRGTLGVDTLIDDLVCTSGADGLVTLDVSERGRVNSLVGSFGLLRLEGRVQGSTRKATREEAPVLRVWKLQRSEIDPAVEHRLTSAALVSNPRGQLIDVDISQLPGIDVPSLKSLHVLSPSAKPLIQYAKKLGPQGHGWALAYRTVFGRAKAPLSHDEIRAEAQRLREIADIVRSRANSGSTYTAAQWAAAHAHALQVRWSSGERLMRAFHRLVGYGVRPLPALFAYLVWTLCVGAALWRWDAKVPLEAGGSAFRNGDYSFGDSILRALLLPAGVLRSDVGGATPYRPAFEHPAAHFALVLGTGVVIGFLAIAIKNFLLRPKSEA